MGKRFFIGLLALCLFSFCIQLALYPSLPETVPIHWNASGEVDGWAGKPAALLMGILPFGIAVLLAVLPKIDPNRESYRKHMNIYRLLSALLVVFFIGVVWLVMLSALQFKLPVGGLISAGLGLILLFIGNYMPRIRPNYTFGIRLPWTLANETVWYKTHRFGGRLLMAAGILVGVSGFLPGIAAFAGIAALLAVVIGSSVYAWVIYNRETNQK